MASAKKSGRRIFLAGSVAACALSYGTPASAAMPAAPIQSFVLANWKPAASSPGFARQGVVFKKGDLPAGFSLQLRRKGAPIAAQFDGRVTWSDGSLKFAVMHLRDAPFAAAESRTYELWAKPGAFDNTATHALIDITSRHRFLIQFTSLTEAMDDKTRRSVGSGNFFADFAAHMAHPTRVEAHHAGAVCNGWTGWGMAVDGIGEAPDPHLKTNWHADIWKNADGSIHAIEIAAVVAQDWWSVPDKRMRRYDAMLRDANTGLALYRGVEHPYKSQWITCQNTADNNRGRRHWIGGACPTLTYIPSKAAWVASGLVPPLNLASKPAAYAAISRGGAAYTPCGSQSHRPNIDGSGAYEGRGVLTNPDCIAFMRQTADDVAAARINAHAGLHVFLHYRSDRTHIRPGDSAPDIANTPISMIMGISRGAVPSYDFTADGMPIPVHAYADGRTTPAGKDNYAWPGDNGGVWSVTTGDASHAVNYSYFMYLMEGERYHLEACLDLATNLVHQGIDNLYSNRPQNPVARDGLGRATHAPDTVYDAVAGLNGQERSAGWALVVLGSAAGIVPDRHVAARFIKRLNQQQAIYLRDILATLPADAKAAGIKPVHRRAGPVIALDGRVQRDGRLSQLACHRDAGSPRLGRIHSQCVHRHGREPSL